MYRKLMIGSGLVATAVTVGYTVALVMARQDGLGEGIEVSARASGIAVCAILGLALLSGVAWIAQTANRESAKRDIAPVVVETLTANTDVLAAAVAEQLSGRLDELLNDAVDRGHARVVASVRDIVTSELIAEELNSAVRRAHRYGMITEASGRASVATLRRT